MVPITSVVMEKMQFNHFAVPQKHSTLFNNSTSGQQSDVNHIWQLLSFDDCLPSLYVL